jgi:NAD(P)-dependent dehydrogenase (short-subunit alcohol dehydrogenase family)
VVQRVIQKTLLNPGLTVPLWLLAHYTQKGRAVALDHSKAVHRLKVLMYLGLFRWAQGILDAGAQNNWTSDKWDWNKELVVVTGGSNGFGRILVELFAGLNKNIKVINLDYEKPSYAARKYPSSGFDNSDADRHPANSTTHFLQVDLSSPEQIKQVCEEVRTKYGHPTILINNAGFANKQTILDLSDELLNKVYEVNTMSHFRLAREFLPSMISNNHGMIVTVASLAGFVTPSGLVDYAGTKASAVAFHEGLSSELRDFYNAPRVRTVCLCPNFAATRLVQGFEGIGGRADSFISPLLQPATVAEKLFTKIVSNTSGFVVVPETHAWFAATVRSWPYWLQVGLSKRLGKTLKLAVAKIEKAEQVVKAKIEEGVKKVEAQTDVLREKGAEVKNVVDA